MIATANYFGIAWVCKVGEAVHEHLGGDRDHRGREYNDHRFVRSINSDARRVFAARSDLAR
jgi:hypothetical protein